MIYWNPYFGSVDLYWHWLYILFSIGIEWISFNFTMILVDWSIIVSTQTIWMTIEINIFQIQCDKMCDISTWWIWYWIGLFHSNLNFNFITFLHWFLFVFHQTRRDFLSSYFIRRHSERQKMFYLNSIFEQRTKN